MTNRATILIYGAFSFLNNDYFHALIITITHRGNESRGKYHD